MHVVVNWFDMSRRAASKIDVNLFPFLSVLCAMIGVLILFLLLTISSRVVESADVPTAGRPATSRTATDVGDLDPDEYQRLLTRIDELESTLAERHKQIAELSALQSAIRDRLAAAQSGTDQATGPIGGVDIQPRVDVQLVEDPQYSVKKRPRFLEISATEVVSLPQGRHFPVQELHQSDSALRRLLAGVDRNRDHEYLLLLIRPNGAETFRLLRAYIAESFPANSRDMLSRIDVGHEPFSAGWVLVSQDLKGSSHD